MNATVTITVAKSGAKRSITVLASRLLAWEIASVIATFAAGVAIGKWVL